jgi:hypothetical protein
LSVAILAALRRSCFRGATYKESASLHKALAPARAPAPRGTIATILRFDGYCARQSGARPRAQLKEAMMNGIIYLVGLLVVVMAILSLLGLR